MSLQKLDIDLFFNAKNGKIDFTEKRPTSHWMRRILVNHADKKRAEKRGSGGEKVLFDETIAITDELNLDLLALDEALNLLAYLDKEKAELVEMKFFGGMTIKEISEVTGKSTATIELEWAFARGWLLKTLTETK